MATNCKSSSGLPLVPGCVWGQARTHRSETPLVPGWGRDGHGHTAQRLPLGLGGKRNRALVQTCTSDALTEGTGTVPDLELLPSGPSADGAVAPR